MFDYHHHSANSVDSLTPMAKVCAAALARGITEIAFTEHMDFIPEESNTGYFAYDAYMAEIGTCRRRFGADLAVLAAIEIDYCPDFEDEIAAWLRGKEFDFVVGSVHYLRGRGNISEPRALRFFDGLTVEEAYEVYFDLVRRSAQFGMWDALGHLDLIKRYAVKKYGPFEPLRFAEIIDEILAILVEKGIALEINTSGMRQPPKELYPHPDVLRRYRELGGSRLTVGSDSHDERDVGRGIPDALRLVEETGFAHVERFRERRSLGVPIRAMIAA